MLHEDSVAEHNCIYSEDNFSIIQEPIRQGTTQSGWLR